MTSPYPEEERRVDHIIISMDKIENCVYKALAKYKKEEKLEELESFRLHQAECPAYQSGKTVKWLISLPVISTIVTVVVYYLSKKHGTQ